MKLSDGVYILYEFMRDIFKAMYKKLPALGARRGEK